MRPTRLEKPAATRSNLKTIAALLPYLWEFKVRVILALSLLVLAKLANVSVPLVLKEIVDVLDLQHLAGQLRTEHWVGHTFARTVPQG